jgi:magnesium-transporting ATPase (P-type)
VLTGDKQETAINIGFACRLITKDMNMLVINQSTKEDTRNKLNDLLQKYESVGEESEVCFISKCLLNR